MLGYIVNHSGLGLGKIVEVQNCDYMVKFLNEGQLLVEKREIKRAWLELNQVCKSDKGKKCVIIDRKSDDDDGPRCYTVQYVESGLKSKISEEKLVPLKEIIQLVNLTEEESQNPIIRLKNLGHGSYGMCAARARLVDTYSRMISIVKGQKALLSSRIDLWPHQAFVANTILQDRVRRYILADEVGLGKTIEAGIVIHDLLSNMPEAKVLILCPGALSLQWLCEIYSKFGGCIFTLLDWHSQASFDFHKSKHFIASMTVALGKHRSKIVSEKWDMVIIDETHHLLWSPKLYDFAMSIQSKALLLLSATPARHREEEYLKLLALLEPTKYGNISKATIRNFKALYDQQELIGRRLRILRARIEGVKNGEYSNKDVLEKLNNLLALDVLKKDLGLSEMAKGLNVKTKLFLEEVENIFYYTSDKYRISRRILKNRRQRLIQEEQLVKIERRSRLFPYEPDQLEVEAIESLDALLMEAKNKKVPEVVFISFGKVIMQCLADPEYLLKFINHLNNKEPKLLEGNGEIFEYGNFISYKEFNWFWGELASVFKSYVSLGSIEKVLKNVERWKESSSSNSRFKCLKSILKKHKSSGLSKIIIFVGFPQMAINLADALALEFDPKSVTTFHYKLDAKEKEKNVQRFKEKIGPWILVSDETGGEGRNFQFASEIIHYDTPFNIGRIEQRIGRLDRLGREKYGFDSVTSNIIFNKWSAEANLVECCEKGLKVYSQTISGLEFALKEIDNSLFLNVFDSNEEKIGAFIEELKDLAIKERVADESEELYDEASFDRRLFESFKMAKINKEMESDFEKVFVEYFEQIAPRGSSRSGNNYERIILKPSYIRKIQIPSEYIAKYENKEWEGTFNRTLAQERTDLSFFSVGNPLFDTIIKSLYADPNGRDFAIEKLVPGKDEWKGFKFVFYLLPDLSSLKNEGALKRKAESILSAKPVTMFLKESGVVEDDLSIIKMLSGPLRKEDKSRTWWNLTKEKSSLIENYYGFKKWVKILDKAFEVAKKEANRQFLIQIDEEIQAEEEAIKKLISQNKKQLKNDSINKEMVFVQEHVTSEIVFETEALELLLKSIKNWDTCLDSVGFISVNGGLMDEYDE